MCWQNPHVCMRDLNERHPSPLLTHLLNCQNRILAFLKESPLFSQHILTINVLLILQVRDIFFLYAGKILNGAFRGVFEELEAFLAP